MLRRLLSPPGPGLCEDLRAVLRASGADIVELCDELHHNSRDIVGEEAVDVVGEAFVQSLLCFQRIVGQKMLLFGGRNLNTQDCDRLEDAMAMGAKVLKIFTSFS